MYVHMMCMHLERMPLQTKVAMPRYKATLNQVMNEDTHKCKFQL